MGLDMYLYATLYTNRKYTLTELNKKLDKLTADVAGAGNIGTIEIKKEVGYWRKDNQIHKWFVDNIQDGVDECDNSFVSREKLKELLDLCKKVMANRTKAKELLPAQEGFFFGTYEYDKWYFQGIENTIEIIEKCLKIPEGWDFEYRASW